MIVNSGATDEENGNSTDYGKIAKAIGDIQTAGIKVSLADINKSQFGFYPDVDSNTILFGLKGMLNVGDDLIKTIIENRPYNSFNDFYYRVKPNKQAAISLIKGGAFDSFCDRKFLMAYFIWNTCDKKNQINLRNMLGLIRNGLIPESLTIQKSIFEFNRYLKTCCLKNKDDLEYLLDDRALNFLSKYDSSLISTKTNNYLLNVKFWEKRYQKEMDIVRDWMKENQAKILDEVNVLAFKQDWDKYASGTISSWEMEVLCFYYHDHELKNVNSERYGIVNFFSLPERPEVEESFVFKGRAISRYKLHKICGTCISKNKNKSTVTLLTTFGVVNIRFRKEYFALFDKQISERSPDGTSKKIMEKSWFNRGNMIVVMGVRNGDDFIPKKYSNSVGAQLYKIDEIIDNGENLILRDKRYQGDLEDE